MWKKFGVGIGVFVLGALGGLVSGAFTNYFQPSVESKIASVVEKNTPILEYQVRSSFQDSTLMWIPSGAIANNDFQDIDDLSFEEQGETVLQKGGFIFGKSEALLTVVGTKSSSVRINNITHESSCTSIVGGDIFVHDPRAAGGPGADTLGVKQLTLNVAQKESSVVQSTADTEQGGGAPMNYFQTETIVVDRGQSQQFNILLDPGASKCETTLQIEVSEIGKESQSEIVRVPLVDTVYPTYDYWSVSPMGAYVGKSVCSEIVEVPPHLVSEHMGSDFCWSD